MQFGGITTQICGVEKSLVESKASIGSGKNHTNYLVQLWPRESLSATRGVLTFRLPSQTILIADFV
jgi:hypothetical protein